jgi:predicted metal-binding protein
MTNVAIIRCEKNLDRCPLTSCFQCLREKKEGFANYEDCKLVGTFTCHCPGDVALDQAKILKKKGADVIHFATCTFAKKAEGAWVMEEGGFCDHIDQIIERIRKEVNIPCVKGTAHLPKNYNLQT